jgi:hypothetical protein
MCVALILRLSHRYLRGFALLCDTCEPNDCPLNRVIEATPAVLIVPNDHPGKGRDETDVGDKMLMLSLSLCEAAAGRGAPRARIGKGLYLKLYHASRALIGLLRRLPSTLCRGSDTRHSSQ